MSNKSLKKYEGNKEHVITDINWDNISNLSNQSMFETPRDMKPEELRRQFEEDTKIVAEQTLKFMGEVYPAYLMDGKKQVLDASCKDSNAYLSAFKFFRIKSCIVGNIDDIPKYLNDKMTKFFSAMHGFDAPIAYGVISENGIQNLVLGVYDKENESVPIKKMLSGLIDGVDIEQITPNFDTLSTKKREMGIVSAIPSVKIGENKQVVDLSPLMRSISGHDYMIMFISKPISNEVVSSHYGNLIEMRDCCFAVSKRNISRQMGTNHSEGATNSHSETHGITKTNGINYGLSFILSVTGNHSKAKSETISDSFGKSFSDAISRNDGISSEIQNGYALEMIDYLNKAIERYRIGRNNGMWETAISYSAPDKYIADMIRSHLLGELSKPDPDMLPPICNQFSFDSSENTSNSMLVPNFFENEEKSMLTTAISSEELGIECNLPFLSVPNFEIRRGMLYPMQMTTGEIAVGKVCAGNEEMDKMTFSLSKGDLAKHTFVCGITGSGKTTTVKSILSKAGVPFCVIESAKKEYRNISLGEGKSPRVYTLGKPEINCTRFNPFYIQYGVSPQMHIDYLKDLFNASFSFYGPMPYILEKCLYKVYEKRGWNLELGYHPYFANLKNDEEFFESKYVEEQYKKKAHRFLFPTMDDLKNEILRYIEQEMDYEGEVAGNIKTAITARLEGLCTGPKGYMFNTNDYLDMEQLLSEPTVLELEGLSDDSDKAFCVGLLIIFINEYRQIAKETEKNDEELNHLLVIEEAHRLLKNVETERSSENMGNPKGKAVEHFTNMIAEMRSYGQGVIIAEQIPTKLAPDVIKNSSNKIIQRLVASDDQKVVANTIGMREEDAIFIGNVLPHYALCHKEGMALPMSVLVNPVAGNAVSDTDLYRNSDIEEKFKSINLDAIKRAVADELPEYAYKMLNSLLIKDTNGILNDIAAIREAFEKKMKLSGRTLLFCDKPKKNDLHAEVLSEEIVKLLHSGAYSIGKTVSDDLLNNIIATLTISKDSKTAEDTVNSMKKELKTAYGNEDPKYKGKLIITRLILRQMTENIDLCSSIKQYFITCDDKSILEIKDLIITEGRKIYANGSFD